ncbi:MAG TPA: hypothetical protein VH393_02375, partial [Ktedonobacterales bacterium]
PAIAGAGARGVVASSPPPATEGGFRGMLKQMRETFTAAQQTAAEQAANKAGGANGAGGATGSNGTNGSGGANGASTTGATGATKSYTKNQKPRPPKSGVKLVKPSATNPRPEDEILRDASSSSNGKAVAPEDAIKRDALADGDGDEADA